MKKILSIFLMLIPALIHTSAQNNQLTASNNVTENIANTTNSTMQQNRTITTESTDQKGSNLFICLLCCCGPCFCCCPKETMECIKIITKQPSPAHGIMQ